MNKKQMFITMSLLVIIIISIPMGLIYLLNNGNPYAKYMANKYVPEYLEEKGYTADEINDSHYVEPKHITNKEFYQGHYSVVFKDETDTTYYYGITKKGKEVRQFCEKDVLSSDGVTHTVKNQTKYSEENCVNSLDNRD